MFSDGSVMRPDVQVVYPPLLQHLFVPNFLNCWLGKQALERIFVSTRHRLLPSLSTVDSRSHSGESQWAATFTLVSRSG